MANVASVVDRFLIEHETGVDAKGGSHCQPLCYGTPSILPFVAPLKLFLNGGNQDISSFKVRPALRFHQYGSSRLFQRGIWGC